MLIISVKPDESDDVLIFDTGEYQFVVKIMAHKTKPNQVRVGITAPAKLRVARKSAWLARAERERNGSGERQLGADGQGEEGAVFQMDSKQISDWVLAMQSDG
jgi:sRNA-binding carbon storage regulator CsrA